MGSNNYTSVVDGQIIQAAHVEQYKTGLTGDILPRNLSGVPTDNAGNLGSYTYIWNNIYGYTYRIGSSATNNYIANTTQFAGSDLDFYIGGTKRVTFDETGMNGSYLTNLSVTEGKIANLAITNDKIAGLTIQDGKIASNTITNQKIQIRTLTREKMCNVAFSEAISSSGSYSTSTFTMGSNIQLTCSVPANDTGLTDSNTIIKPIMIMFTCPYNTTSTGSFLEMTGAGTGDGFIYVTKDMPFPGTETHRWTFRLTRGVYNASSSFCIFDNDFTAGEYGDIGNIVYRAYFRPQTTGETVAWNNIKMVAFPIK